MIVHNETKISIELIRAIALDVGLDLRVQGDLFIKYSTNIKGGNKDGNNGTCQSVMHGLEEVHLIKLVPWATTETLAHELRHAAQCQILGIDAAAAIYQQEEDIEGYHGNILEVDAREAGTRWAAMAK